MTKRYVQKRTDKRPDKPLPSAPQPSAEDLAQAADAEREMYGEDYEYLRDSGWLDR